MIEWNTNPNLGTYIELQNIVPVILDATEFGSDDILYTFIEPIPQFLQINDNVLSGVIGELDDWFYTPPADFSYNTTETYGGNYCNFGSGLAGTTNVSFVIRAYRSSNPSNFSDQTFTVNVRNNYSSDRDRMIIDHISNLELFVNGQKVTPQDFIQHYKDMGYYL
jgi:hypothetical protein